VTLTPSTALTATAPAAMASAASFV